jgi:hypothetical protein
VLKKTGIVVAVATATMLALSPLAFASQDGHGHDGQDVVKNTGQQGLINAGGNTLNAPIQACNNDVPINGGAAAVQTPVKDLTGSITGAAALLGSADSRSSVQADNSRSCGDNSGSVADDADIK